MPFECTHVRGFGVGDDADSPCQAPETVLEGAALGAGPDPLCRDAQRGHLAPGDPPPREKAAEDIGKAAERGGAFLHGAHPIPHAVLGIPALGEEPESGPPKVHANQQIVRHPFGP